MAVLANNSEGSSVPPEVAQNLEVDDEYNKYTPSADYNSASGRLIFRNKKFTKKRHESKSRRTDVVDDASNACASDEDYPQASTSRHVEINVHGNLPTILSSINNTIQKMSIKDNVSSIPPASHSVPGPVPGTSKGCEKFLGDATSWRDTGMGGSTTNLEVDEASQQQLLSLGTSNNSSSNLQAQGKRRRHRRKQQYKRMAVDVQSEKKCVQLKVPTSNSSEDSGIGKRKRNLVPTDGGGLCGGAVIVARVPVPVVPTAGPSTSRKATEPRVVWGMDCEDAVMMDCEEAESNSNTKVLASESMNVTAEETGESDTQNDDIESLSDNNQDADDEESDYYNNDSSTTSLSESSFTVLNSSKKFIPVHSREIRSGRRRLKDNHLSSIENEEVSKFIQSPGDTVLKVYPSSDRERQDFMSIANRFSLTLEEGHGNEDQRNWVQFTKTPKTTSTQRKNDMIKAAIGDRFTESSSLAAFLDTFGNENGEGGDESDSCMDGGSGASAGNTLIRGAIGTNQLVNSKRIKKGC